MADFEPCGLASQTDIRIERPPTLGHSFALFLEGQSGAVMRISGHPFQVPQMSTQFNLQNSVRGLPQPRKMEVLHKSEVWRKGCKCILYPPFVYLIFFLISPTQMLGHPETLAPTQLSIWRIPHFRVIKRHSPPIPTPHATYTQSPQFWIAGPRPQGGCAEGSVDL